MIADLLTSYPIKRISHIGSTAIQKIWAKNIVDVMIEISENADIEEISLILEQNGFIKMSDEKNRISLNMGYTKDGFADPYGKLISPNTVTHDFHEVIKKNGLKMLRFHDLRHSCASLLLANDIPMKAIQEWLGHATFNITANLYSHLEYNAKVASAETISRVLGAKKEDTPAENEQSEKTETESEKPAPKKLNSRKKKKDTPAESSHPTAV